MAHAITTELADAEINSEEELEVIVSSLRRCIKNKYLKNILNLKDETRGRKQTPMVECTNIWKFWHENSESSTLTSRPAKIRVNMVPNIQNDLKFDSGVKQVINKRKIKMLVSPWLLTNGTVRSLHMKYKIAYNSIVSYGTFRSLLPFYIRSPTSKDVEMCLCKDHLHARWAVNTLLKLTKKQDIGVNFDSYETFFTNAVYSSRCTLPDNSSEYIKWPCTPSRRSVCEDIQANFENLKTKLISKSDNQETVKMLHFVTREEKTKKGKLVKRLKAESVQANITWVLDFIVHNSPP